MNTVARRSWGLVRLLALVLYELALSSIRVAWDVVTPRHRSRPGILAVPLDARSDVEITVLASLICLTPGSLCLDVSADRRTLYVHSMFIGEPDRDRQALKDSFERRVLKALR
jgi:multicomponent Na+:H+ antiporter subunit E